MLNHKVKNLKTRSKSAGNSFMYNVYKTGTSETLRNEIIINTETAKAISIHVAKHLKPANDIEFGHYLAGLIDGDGHFSSKQQLIIVYNSLDIQLAYYIKKQIGYGSIQKVKNKNAVILVVAAAKGVEKVINLINGKFRSTTKFDQITRNILANKKFLGFNKKIILNRDNNLENHWLAGFSDADASFKIKLINRNKKTEVCLNYQIDQKRNYLLIFIKDFLGGNIGYRKKQDTYYYGSTSYGSAKKVINYFDHYHMLSTKYVNFLKWRKVYILIKDKNHLNDLGLTKIKKIKNTINRLGVNIVI